MKFNKGDIVKTKYGTICVFINIKQASDYCYVSEADENYPWLAEYNGLKIVCKTENREDLKCLGIQ